MKIKRKSNNIASCSSNCDNQKAKRQALQQSVDIAIQEHGHDGSTETDTDTSDSDRLIKRTKRNSNEVTHVEKLSKSTHPVHEWNYVPHAVLVNIMSYLDPVDRIRASSTCNQWRNCYFYPNFWRNVQLCRSKTWGWKGAEMAIERCGKYVHSVSIFPYTSSSVIFDIPAVKNVVVAQQRFLSQTIQRASAGIPRLLERLVKHCTNLERFQLKNPGVYSTTPKDLDSPQVDIIWQNIEDLLKSATSMEHLMLGYYFDIIGEGRLHQLAKCCGKTLKTLHCSVFTIRRMHPPPNIEPFKAFTQLTDIRLNLMYVTDQLLGILASKDHCPVKSLVILAVISELMDVRLVENTSNEAWEQLVVHSPELQVAVSYHWASNYCESLASLLRKSAIPLRHFKILSYEEALPDTVFDLIQNNYNHVLHHLELHYANVAMTRFVSDDEDQPNPVIMTMWKCSNIKNLIITGFCISADDIVGIARLRGSTLKVLGIQGDCIKYEKPVNTRDMLQTEVSKCLGRDWQPMDKIQSTLTLYETMDHSLLPDNEYGTGPMS